MFLAVDPLLHEDGAMKRRWDGSNDNNWNTTNASGINNNHNTETTIRERGLVTYGTPLETIRTEDGSSAPATGKVKLRGAFKGGFSAGYFNTVGSREGWTPTTFVSKRNNRNEISVKNTVEQYMDEEDIAEMEESKVLRVAGAGVTAVDTDSSMILDGLKPADENMGIILLRRMGWREGTGVGPRIKSTDEHAAGKTLAPKDTPMFAAQEVTNGHGVGFRSDPAVASLRSIVTSTAEGEKEERSRSAKATVAGMRGGFGAGVLNDYNEDEEEDPYEIGPRIGYDKTVGKKLKTRESVKAEGSVKAVAKHAFKSSKSLVSAPLSIASFPAQSVQKRCYDSELPLDGFELASEKLTIVPKQWFAPPEVPKNWSPRPSQSSTNNPGSVGAAAELLPRQRGQLLGEQPLAGKSVFDFLTPAQRERLSLVSGKTNLPPALGEKIDGHASKDLPHEVLKLPSLDREIALAAFKSGFTPYNDDIGRQRRYRHYLEVEAGLDLLGHRQGDIAKDVWIASLYEFRKTAQMFKPMSKLMNKRFTSNFKSDLPEDQSVEQEGPVKTSQETAAQMGMFGHQTRTVEDFFPTRLLCKRFNVKDPHPDAKASSNAVASAQNEGEMLNQSVMQDILQEAAGDGLVGMPVLEHQMVNEGMNETLEVDRPDMSIFRAIFGADSDEEGD